VETEIQRYCVRLFKHGDALKYDIRVEFQGGNTSIIDGITIEQMRYIRRLLRHHDKVHYVAETHLIHAEWGYIEEAET
jgi:hypothetical protein